MTLLIAESDRNRRNSSDFLKLLFISDSAANILKDTVPYLANY